MTEMDYYEYIDAYKKGELAPDLRIAFESKMRADKSLQNAVENHDIAKEIAGGLVEIEAAEIFEKMEKEKASSKKHALILRWASVAAAVLVLISAVFVFDLFSSEVNNRTLADNFYVKPQYIGTRSASETSDPLQQAKLSFEKNDFEKSDSIFSLLIDDTEASDIANYYLANSYFLQGKFQEVFGFLDDCKDEGLKWALDYLRALAFLSLDEEERAKRLLNGIAESSSTYKGNASALLNELK